MGRTVEEITFGGVVFRRWPKSKHRTDRVYFTATGGARLHRAIWEHQHGVIPPGHDVHHADGDTLNNEPHNLECLPESEHHALHAAEWTEERRDRQRQHIANIRPLASEWHGSEAGREWHREHGKQTWVGREVCQKTCEHCGGSFETKDRRKAARFCSSKCRSYARKVRGDDDVARTCPVCQAGFTVNAYSRSKTCSRVCGQRLRFGGVRPGV